MRGGETMGRFYFLPYIVFVVVAVVETLSLKIN